MNVVPFCRYATLRDVPFPKGHVYWFAPDQPPPASLQRGAMTVRAVDENAMPKRGAEYTLVGTGDGAQLDKAKCMAVRWGLPLVWLVRDYADVEALSPLVPTLCPIPVMRQAAMRCVLVEEILAHDTHTAALYATLLGAYVGLFDAYVAALWHNEDTTAVERLSERVRQALLSQDLVRDAATMWDLSHEALGRVRMQNDWFLPLISLYKGEKKPYNQYRFAAYVCLAEALHRAPNLPPTALPPNRHRVLETLENLGVRVWPALMDGEEHRRRDWIWQTVRPKAHDYFADTDAMCALHRRLLPDCGWQADAGLDVWDLVQCLPALAELGYADTVWGHLYRRGDWNTWVC